MSPIMELIKAADPKSEINAYFALKDALPDLQRLVVYIQDEAYHGPSCGYLFEGPCDCGLSEIQSLLGE